MVGWLDYIEPEKARKPYVYYPIIDLQEQEQEHEHEQQTKQSVLPQPSQSIMTPLDYDLPQPRLLMHKNFREISKDWLEIEIWRLISYPVILDTFELFNTNKQKTCICAFVKEYSTTANINGLFSKPDFHKNHNKIFGSIKYVGDMDPEHRRSQSSHLIMDSLDYKDAIISSTIKNISYQQQIVLKESGLQASQASPKQKQEEPSSAKADSECSMTLEYNYEYNTTKKDTE
jgi:hypothetical protein